MTKKWKIIMATVVVVVVLSLAGTAVVLAADSTTPTTPTTQSNSLFAKVAGILGVTEAQLTGAIKQASTQLGTQKLNQLIDQAVTNKTLTQDEATALKNWLAQRPDPSNREATRTWEQSRPKVANPGALRWLLAGPKVMIGNIRGGINNTELLNSVASLISTASGKTITADQLKNAFTQAEQQMKATAVDNALSNAVKNNKITQDEANATKSWWDQRPAAVDKLAPSSGFPFHGCSRGEIIPCFRGIMPGKILPPTPSTAPTN
jgi:hypothetical protein